MEAEDRALELFKEGYNCAESVLMATCEALGRIDPDIPRMATAFGGGIGRSGSVCGALTGAAMAIGLVHGRNTSKEPPAPAYERAQRLYGEFHRAMGTTLCRELTGVDLGTPEGMQRFHDSGIRDRVCNPAVSLATRLAQEMTAAKGAERS